jgi:hypothetical protein
VWGGMAHECACALSFVLAAAPCFFFLFLFAVPACVIFHVCARVHTCVRVCVCLWLSFEPVILHGLSRRTRPWTANINRRARGKPAAVYAPAMSGQLEGRTSGVERARRPSSRIAPASPRLSSLAVTRKALFSSLHIPPDRLGRSRLFFPLAAVASLLFSPVSPAGR